MKNPSDIIYGRHPVIEAIEQGALIDKILLQQGTRGELEITLRYLCRSHNIPLVVVPKEKLQRLTRSNHQGVIALIGAATYQTLSNIVPQVFEQGRLPLILILDGITDVRNFGAIGRTAACTGVDAIVVPSKSAAPLNAEAMKTSAGGLMHVPVCRENSLVNVCNYLKDSGVHIFATTLHAQSVPLPDVNFQQPVAIIMGSEDTGVSPALIRLADTKVRIPQIGPLDSLNVSVAAGMVLYESLRQRLFS